ncbi:hypothetical protein [Allocoleopsis sp.]|uniref:hypothetical protein n=1 Tax=Allocoleopsis sp. TaxID=3088169 RepID=UPI002FCFA42C
MKQGVFTASAIVIVSKGKLKPLPPEQYRSHHRQRSKHSSIEYLMPKTKLFIWQLMEHWLKFEELRVRSHLLLLYD